VFAWKRVEAFSLDEFQIVVAILVSFNNFGLVISLFKLAMSDLPIFSVAN
jgi:hypothetical protein